mgnify:CR=1 FL=1
MKIYNFFRYPEFPEIFLVSGLVLFFTVLNISYDAKGDELYDRDSTVLLMHFDGGKGDVVNDDSGNKNNGKVIYEAVWTKEGKINNALYFEGHQGSVEIPHSNTLALTDRITIEAWIKIKGGTRERVIVSKPGSYGLSIWHAPSSILTARVDLDNGKYFLVHSRKLLRENVWYYVAMTYDGRELSVYVDGELEEKTEANGKIAVTSNKLYISYPSGWQTFDGVIDEVCISNIVRKISPIKKDIPENQVIKPSIQNPFIKVNNAPFFPIGLYCAIWWDQENMKELKEAGFNLIGPRGDFAGVEDWKKFLDSAASHGFKAWIPPLYKQKSPATVLRWATFLIEPELSEKEAVLKNIVLTLKGHPALLIWDIGDEVAIDKNMIPPTAIDKGVKLLKSLDPSHLTWTNHSFMSSYDDILPYNDIADILSYDIYPLYDRGSKRDINIVGKYAELLTRSLKNSKPVWMVIQADHGHQEGRFPTEEEFRFMTYNAIVNGATGIVYFGQDITYGWTPEFKKAIKKVVSELKVLQPILVASNYNKEINLKITPHETWIQGICKEYKGEKYLIAINEESGGPVNVNFIFTDFKKISKVELLFEDRTIDSDGNSFTDEFKPYDVHIYKIDSS